MDGFVEVYDSVSGVFIASTVPDADGTFRIAELPAHRDLRVRYADFSGAANMWFGSAATFPEASTVRPKPAGTSLGTRALQAAGAIVGTFPSPPGFVGTFECVTAWFENGYYVASTCGEVGKFFELSHLPMGVYELEFSDEHGHYAQYSTTGDWSTASRLSVNAGQMIYLGPTVFTSTGAIAVAFEAAGGPAGRWGAPTSSVSALTSTNGNGQGQNFAHGQALSSSEGTFFVPKRILSTYASNGWIRGALGWPTAEAVCEGSGACTQTFQGGTVAVPAGTGAGTATLS
jgi:hypothetical protein